MSSVIGVITPKNTYHQDIKGTEIAKNKEKNSVLNEDSKATLDKKAVNL